MKLARDGTLTFYIQGPPIGDLDLDGVVGIVDFLTLLGDWGPCPGPPEACHSDLDGNDEVGIVDFLLLLGNWGPQDLAGGTNPGMWINGGPGCATEPDVQVHMVNDDSCQTAVISSQRVGDGILQRRRVNPS